MFVRGRIGHRSVPGVTQPARNAGCKVGEPSGFNRGTNISHKRLVIRQIMPSEEHRAEHFSGTEQMMEICSTVFCASRTLAVMIQRTGIVRETGVAQVLDTRRRVGAAGSACPGWDHAIKHVDPTLHCLKHVIWRPDTHEISRRSPVVDGAR